MSLPTYFCFLNKTNCSCVSFWCLLLLLFKHTTLGSVFSLSWRVSSKASWSSSTFHVLNFPYFLNIPSLVSTTSISPCTTGSSLTDCPVKKKKKKIMITNFWTQRESTTFYPWLFKISKARSFVFLEREFQCKVVPPEIWWIEPMWVLLLPPVSYQTTRKGHQRCSPTTKKR